jgi:hypothetical protein
MSDSDPDPSGGRSGRSWWTTLPGILTAAAGLITAVTGLVVAIQQLRPSHSASASAVTAPLVSDPGVMPTAVPQDLQPAGSVRVAFTAGRHAESGNLRYDVVHASVTPANPGQIRLALRVRIANDGSYSANFWSRTFRLQTGAGTSAPENLLDDVVAGGTTQEGEIDFVLPAATRSARLLVGDDPAQAVALPITLGRG